MAGSFEQDLNIDGTILNASSQDIFFTQLHIDGDVNFAKKAGGSGADKATDIQTGFIPNQDDPLYITGYITGEAYFDNYTVTAPANKQSMFIAKYNFVSSDDEPIVDWVKTGTHDGNVDFEYSMMVIDSEGNAIIAGSYTGTFRLQGSSSVMSAGSSQKKGAFIAKYSTDGQLIWSKNIGTSWGMHASAIEIDDSDNVTVVGEFTGVGSFPNSSSNSILNSNGGTDLFFTRFDKNGNQVWIKQEGGTEDDFVYDLATDGDGKFVYVAEIDGECIIDQLNCDLVTDAVIFDAYCGGSNGSIRLILGGEDASGATFSWSTGATTKDIDQLSAGDYGVTINAGEDCGIFELPFTIYNDPYNYLNDLIVEVDPANIDDASDCVTADGYVVIEMGGGYNGEFSYEAPNNEYSGHSNNGYATAELEELLPGSYHLTITSGSCERLVPFEVGPTDCEPCDLTTTVNIEDATCEYSNGSIKLLLSGQDAVGATFLWSTGATTKDIDQLSAGDYTVTIDGGQNCGTIERIYTVEDSDYNSLDDLDIAIDVDDASNCVIADGYVIIEMEGEEFWEYSYVTSNGVTGSSEEGYDEVKISDMAAGNYEITITMGSCEKIVPFEVGPTNCEECVDFDITAMITNVNCKGTSTGSITINPINGKAPYTYEWNTGETTSGIFNKAAGLYEVSITDDNGCFLEDLLEISEPVDELSVNLDIANVTSNSIPNGAITINVQNGWGPDYIFECEGIDNTFYRDGAIQQDPGSVTISNLPAGNYEITVKDDNMCEIKLQAEVDISCMNNFPINPTITHVKCKNARTGSIILNPEGDNQDYSYEWSTGEETSGIYQKSAGSYIVTVTDQNGCYTEQTISINEPNEVFTVSSQVRNIKCKGRNRGSILLTAHGGTEPYTYIWEHTDDSSPNQYNLFAGIYNVTIVDANDCWLTRNMEVEEPKKALFFRASGIDATNWRVENGRINLNVQDGWGPDYFWECTGIDVAHSSVGIIENNPGSTQIAGLAAGEYQVSVTDYNDCTITRNVVIEQPCGMRVSASVGFSSGRNCKDNPQWITIRVTNVTFKGGQSVPFSDLEFLWDNGSTTSSIRYNGDPFEEKWVLVTHKVEPNCSNQKFFVPFDWCGSSGSLNNSEIENRNSGNKNGFRSTKQKIHIYPNPFNNFLNIDIATNTQDELDINIYDLVGRLIYTQKVSTTIGMNKVQVDMSRIANAGGVYHVVVSGKETPPQNFKVVKMK